MMVAVTKELDYNIEAYREIRSLYSLYRDPLAMLVSKLDISTKMKVVETVKFIKEQSQAYTDIVEALDEINSELDNDDDEYEQEIING